MSEHVKCAFVINPKLFFEIIKSIISSLMQDRSTKTSISTAYTKQLLSKNIHPIKYNKSTTNSQTCISTIVIKMSLLQPCIIVFTCLFVWCTLDIFKTLSLVWVNNLHNNTSQPKTHLSFEKGCWTHLITICWRRQTFIHYPKDNKFFHC